MPRSSSRYLRNFGEPPHTWRARVLGFGSQNRWWCAWEGLFMYRAKRGWEVCSPFSFPLLQHPHKPHKRRQRNYKDFLLCFFLLQTKKRTFPLSRLLYINFAALSPCCEDILRCSEKSATGP